MFFMAKDYKKESEEEKSVLRGEGVDEKEEISNESLKEKRKEELEKPEENITEEGDKAEKELEESEENKSESADIIEDSQEKNKEDNAESDSGKAKEKSKEYRIKETEEDVALGSEKDASPEALKEEIKKEAEKSDIFMKYLAPVLAFLLVGGIVSAATWYYAKPERASQKSEEKIQTPPEVKEEPEQAPAETQPAQPAAPATPEKKETTYTVKEGDTMSSIANANGLTSQELAAYNGITDVNSLHIGQVLKIPTK